MTDDLLKRQRYALAKRRGYSDDEAAERAGLSGNPSDGARRLLKLVRDESRGEDEDLRRNLQALSETLKSQATANVFRKAKLEQARELLEHLLRDVSLRIEAVEVLQHE